MDIRGTEELISVSGRTVSEFHRIYSTRFDPSDISTLQSGLDSIKSRMTATNSCHEEINERRVLIVAPN
jgi:hypothetical protein